MGQENFDERRCSSFLSSSFLLCRFFISVNLIFTKPSDSFRAISSDSESLSSASFELINILNPAETFNSIFEVIVSNPPYVLESERALMKKNVLEYEPHQALFVKNTDPLIFYKKIIDFAENQLKSQGRIYFEINESKGMELTEYLKRRDYFDIELKRDIFERSRMIRAIKK